MRIGELEMMKGKIQDVELKNQQLGQSTADTMKKQQLKIFDIKEMCIHTDQTCTDAKKIVDDVKVDMEKMKE